MNTAHALDVALLILRLALGLALFAHGTQKLFGWFGGGGIAGTGAGMASMGFRPGKINAVLAGLGEAGGGLLLAFGLLTPLGGAAVAATMIVHMRRSLDWTWPRSPPPKATYMKRSASCARTCVTAPTTGRRRWNCPNAPKASSPARTG